MTEQELETELTQVRLLSALTYPALRRIVAQGRLIQAREGQVIVGPRLGSTGLFVIVEGSVAVSMPFGPVLSYLGPREVFGEIALLEGGERTAYCRAYTDVLLFEIPFECFHADLVPNDVVREALDEMTVKRRAEQQVIRDGGPAPELTPPAKPARAEVGEPEAGSPAAAAEEAPQPPAVYVTA